jgi:hypothetical protein
MQGKLQLICGKQLIEGSLAASVAVGITFKYCP